jgi:NAD(P)-dependent dehydrogenase (short-subunit alcohol dehydrogenase family)
MLLETIRTQDPPMDMTDLAGKTAVVTGGASGIGLALARRLKAEGMKVLLADLDEEALGKASAELDAPTVRTDIRDPASTAALAREAAERLGQVDLLCANAGVGRMAGIEHLSPEDWRWLFEVNVFGAVNTVQAFLPLLKANPTGGHVLITASLSSLYPTRAQGAYAATKYALAAFGETLALELQAEGAKVGVSLLCPGPVRTNIGSGYARREARYVAKASEGPGPDIHEKAFRDTVVDEDWRTPDQIADEALKGLRRGELWIITHPDMMGPTLARAREIEAAAARARV